LRHRDEFLSIASHELRTPLTTIKAYVQLQERHLRQPAPDLPHLNSLTEQLMRQVRRLEELVIDLLDVTQLHQGHLTLHAEPVDLSLLAGEVLTRFEHAPERTARHRLRLVAPAPVVGIWDPARLDQVLTNLVSNAIKYSPEGGEVLVSVGDVGGRALVEVRDQGVGIAAVDLPRLFRPFARGTADRRAIPGVGLGLYIAAQIVERHGGRLTVASQPGEGSTFRLDLPSRPVGEAAEVAPGLASGGSHA
jgi:signal transduction histidine kinase